MPINSQSYMLSAFGQGTGWGEGNANIFHLVLKGFDKTLSSVTKKNHFTKCFYAVLIFLISVFYDLIQIHYKKTVVLGIYKTEQEYIKKSFIKRIFENLFKYN